MNTKHIINNPEELLHNQGFKFYTPIAMAFVSLFVVVNIISQKIVPITGNIILTAGDFVYPLSYTLSIILTEVYGYTMSRRIIWSAFFCNLIVAGIITFAISLPNASLWSEQREYAMILGRTPRLLAASFAAFLIGEFIGTYTLAKIKIFTSGKHLWFRTIGSTVIGQLIDSIAFTSIAFFSIVSWHDIITLSLSAYWCKMAYQIVMTPGTYAFANFLKKQEQIDIFDRNTNFNPFKVKI